MFVGILILGFTFNLFNGVTLPEDMFYLVAAYGGLSLALMLHSNMLTFLTVRKVFITKLMSMFIILGLFLIFFDMVMPGFVVTGFEIKSFSSGFLTIEQYTVDKYATIALISVTAAAIASALDYLKEE